MVRPWYAGDTRKNVGTRECVFMEEIILQLIFINLSRILMVN